MEKFCTPKFFSTILTLAYNNYYSSSSKNVTEIINMSNNFNNIPNADGTDCIASNNTGRRHRQ
eukprot:4603802-Amphidinium_carterae.1